MIDTHTHVIGPNRDRYPLRPRSLSGEWYLEAPHSAEELLGCMDAAGVQQAILVQAVGAYTFDNDYAADAAAAHPTRFASACCIDPVADAAADTLRYWVSDREMHGVRIFSVGRDASFRIDDPRTFPVWEQALALDVAVIVTVLSDQLEGLRTMLRRFPTLRVSLDHCAFPDTAAPAPLFALADEPNLFCKVSSVVLESAGKEPESFVETLTARFGAERVMWGSDFSQTHDRSYLELVALAQRAFGTLSDAQREQCFEATPRTLWPALARAEPA